MRSEHATRRNGASRREALYDWEDGSGDAGSSSCCVAGVESSAAASLRASFFSCLRVRFSRRALSRSRLACVIWLFDRAIHVLSVGPTHMGGRCLSGRGREWDAPPLVALTGARPRRRTGVGHVRQQRHLSRAFDCNRELSLMPATCPGHPRRADLALLRDVAPELARVLVVDLDDLVLAEQARLAPERLPCAARTTAAGSGFVVLLRSRLRGHRSTLQAVDDFRRIRWVSAASCPCCRAVSQQAPVGPRTSWGGARPVSRHRPSGRSNVAG